MDLGLNGRVAIVAASSTGLGFAVAKELSLEGADVAICGRTDSDLQSAVANIQRASGREVFAEPVDVTDAKAVAAFVSAVETRFKRIDVCVTNSGGPPSKLFEETRNEEGHAALDKLLMRCVC